MDLHFFSLIIWSGIVAVAFAVLFNVPKRLLFAIFLVSAISAFIKMISLNGGINIVFSVLFAASFVGFATIPIARYKRTSPFVLSIPAIIPMIPGYFGYEMLLGIMDIAFKTPTPNDVNILMEIIHNASNMVFILGSISLGVSLPWLLFREKGLQKIKMTDDENLL